MKRLREMSVENESPFKAPRHLKDTTRAELYRKFKQMCKSYYNSFKKNEMEMAQLKKPKWWSTGNTTSAKYLAKRILYVFSYYRGNRKSQWPMEVTIKNGYGKIQYDPGDNISKFHFTYKDFKTIYENVISHWQYIQYSPKYRMFTVNKEMNDDAPDDISVYSMPEKLTPNDDKIEQALATFVDGTELYNTVKLYLVEMVSNLEKCDDMMGIMRKNAYVEFQKIGEVVTHYNMHGKLSKYRYEQYSLVDIPVSTKTESGQHAVSVVKINMRITNIRNVTMQILDEIIHQVEVADAQSLLYHKVSAIEKVLLIDGVGRIIVKLTIMYLHVVQ